MLSLGIFRDMSHSHKSVFCGSGCSYLGPYLTAIYTFAARACVDIGWGSLLLPTSTASHWGPWLGWLLSGTKDFPPFLEPHHQQTVCWKNSLSLSQSLVLAAFLVWWLHCKKRRSPPPPPPRPIFLDFSFCLLLYFSFGIASISLSLSLSRCVCVCVCVCVSVCVCLSLSVSL